MPIKKIKKGSLLLAEPSILGDETFARAVILMAEISPNGAVGFILNKPFSFELHELVPDIKTGFKLYNGGPVEEDNLYFIHNVPDLIPNSVEISEGIYWGGDFEVTKKCINSGQLTAQHIRFFLGYSGWAAEQLKEEISAKSWVAIPNQFQDKLIEEPTVNFWQKQLLQLGGDYVLWSNAPENPQLN